MAAQGPTIVNETSADILVRITIDGEAGDLEFFVLQPGNTRTWIRHNKQVAFVLRADINRTEVLVVQPGQAYTIE
ncbi:hypothetical protein ABKN59_003198 [Abortiporus biennis]